jgi:hypothetical protein
MKYLILWLLLTVPAYAEINCSTHKLYCKIIKFNPKIDSEFAMHLSNIIYTKASELQVDPNISLAILMQESGLRHVNTFKTNTTVKEYCENNKCFKIIKEVKEVLDLSIAQININTANHYNFDIERLYRGDLEYAIDCHMTILRDKLKLCAGQENSFACYHSTNEPFRSIYVEMVSRYL